MWWDDFNKPLPNPPVVIPQLDIDTFMTDPTLPAELEPTDTVSIDVPLDDFFERSGPWRGVGG